MDMKIELVNVPVTDVDRAKAFYVDILGFSPDFDQVISAELRFVQLTPTGSACSIVIGYGTTEMTPGSQKGLLMVVDDVTALRAELVGRGLNASEVTDEGWGLFSRFSDPDGNTWALQQLPTEAIEVPQQQETANA
ncbi:MAG: glyoxalase [Glaciihabitans sp.]|nr:glyoxalase [Glaciihabitans sp.]